ncbi:MAG: hypothetical protein GC181_00555 [Bacteroidetes bacterium]|nr:hypothetical protein [Bacteroidota bacterium]
MNTEDSVVTITYSKTEDLCNSFIRNDFWASPNSSTPYILLGTSNNKNQTLIQFKLSDAFSDWSFYISTSNDCFGNPSLTSDIYTIKRPESIEIDSLSFDPNTNELLIGWRNPSGKNIKGYRIYQENGSINSKLADTNTTNYRLSNYPLQKSYPITLAVFDSCDRFSKISRAHKPIVLNITIDSCKQMLKLNWNRYIGWLSDTFCLYISIDGSNYSRFVQLSDTFTQYIYDLGKHYSFFIGTKALSDPLITTSSNSVSFFAKERIPSDLFYISHCSIEEPGTINMQLWLLNGHVGDSITISQIHPAISPSNVAEHKVIQTNSSYNLNYIIDTYDSPYSFIASTKSACGTYKETSNQVSSILLKLENNVLYWSSYDGYINGVELYVLFGFDGFTWNNIAETQDTFYLIQDSYEKYQIVANASTNQFNIKEQSKSNIVTSDEHSTIFIPNAINVNSSNNTFKVLGKNIDVTKSHFILFNRWGEVIYKGNNVLTGYTFNIEGDNIHTDLIFYSVYIYDYQGRQTQQSGYLSIIR